MVNFKLYKGRKLARRMKIQGLDISIETDKGQERHWYDPHNKTEGTTKMKYPYGYVRRTMGADNEHIDVYVGPDENEKTVYVIHQNKAPDFKEYDEDKVMIGFSSPKEAKQAYLIHYNSPKFFDSMDTMTMDEFKNEFVNKAFGEEKDLNDSSVDTAIEEENAQQSQENIEPVNPYNVDDPNNVIMLLNSIATMKDEDLLALAAEIWGDGYEYKPVNQDTIRPELRGFLQDQEELLRATPMLGLQGEIQQMPDLSTLPHTSGSSPKSSFGPEGAKNLSNGENSAELDQTQV